MKKINTLKNIAVVLVMVIMSNITLFFIAQAKEPSHSESKRGSWQLLCSDEFNQDTLALRKSSPVLDYYDGGKNDDVTNGDSNKGDSINSYGNNGGDNNKQSCDHNINDNNKSE